MNSTKATLRNPKGHSFDGRLTQPLNPKMKKVKTRNEVNLTTENYGGIQQQFRLAEIGRAHV